MTDKQDRLIAKAKATEATNAKINSVFRNPRPGSRVTVDETPVQSDGNAFMNAFIRSDPDPTPSFTDTDLQKHINDVSRAERKKLAAAGNAGEGTETLNAFKKPQTMNDAICEILDLRKKLNKAGNSIQEGIIK